MSEEVSRRAALRTQLDPRDYGGKLDGATDNRAALLAAITAASTAGGGRVIIDGPCGLAAPVNLSGVNGVTIEGTSLSKSRIIPLAAPLTSAFTTSGNCSDITFRRMSFVGTATDDVTGPRRSRAYGATGLYRAISLLGDLEAGNVPVISNVLVDGCSFYGTSNLPVFLSGIRGRAEIRNSVFDNNLDVGFTWCQDAVFTGNRVTRSADNGVSLSRGNSSVICANNHFEDCCYWAVWVSGFSGQLGPTDITVTGNTGIRFGHGGVIADIAPKHFAITGNVFRDIYRGPSDIPTDNYGIGVLISGNPSGGETVDDYAQNFSVTGNTIVDVARGGIVVRGAKNGRISGNTIIRPGTEFLSDGTTTITTVMITQNMGISIDPNYASTVSNVDCQDNVIIDDRSIPYLNNAVYGGAATNWWQNNNRAVGNRLQLAETARVIYGGQYAFKAPPRIPDYTTALRPSATTMLVGACIFDSTLGLPLWSNGSAWVDATGTTR